VTSSGGHQDDPAVRSDLARRHPHLVLLVGLFTALAPINTDLYLPLMPQLASELGTTQAAAQATVSAVLLGLAAGQLVIGPLSDAWGRRGAALAGAAGFVACNLASAVAPSIGSLLVIRFLAGLACAACVVVVRAVVTDVYAGGDAARAYATLSAIVTVVPAVAPVFGGLLALVMGWRGIFVVMAGLGVVVLVAGWRSLEESLPLESRREPHLGRVLADLGGLLRLRRFVAYVACLSAAGGVLFAYIGASSFVMQGTFRLTPTVYGFVFALNAFGIFAMANLSRRLVGRTGPHRLLVVGQASSLVGTLVLAVGVWRSALPLVLVGLFVAVGSVGLVVGNSMALGMRQAPDRAGSASGLMGISQFAFGAVTAAVAGIGASPWSMVAAMLVCALLGPALRLVMLGDHGRRPT
jgi:DHA1 family bicyclomycin/chloramphenicol resistance-like MFS transporter